MGNYALVKIINSVETIDNIIVASPEDAALYLIANGGDYDYVLDTSQYSPSPDIGWSYDSGMDTFSPPPEDFQGELEAAIIAVDTAIEDALTAYAACSSGERSTAVGNVLGELSEEDEDELDALIGVISLLQSRYP